MHGTGDFLRDLAVVLCVAALTTVVFQRLRQPVVLGYILAGLIIGPNIPIPLVADLGTVETLAELGVILLMFSIGLEFNVRKLLRLGTSVGLVTAVEVGLMFFLGSSVARALGWGTQLSIFTGAMLSISSTMIVARTFAEQRVERELSELAFGVLIVEDLAAILMLALLSAVAVGTDLSFATVAASLTRLAVFLVALVALGLLVVPRFLGFVVASGSRETTLVATVGICFALALCAEAFGYSVALGAFVAGLLAAESGEGRLLEALVRPLRDVFAAVFFVAVGMLIDPRAIVPYWGPILILTAVVLVGKVVGVSLGALLIGHPTRTAVRAGMSLAQIGEFSFIIAVAAAPLGERARFLFPVAVAVSAITSFTTPYLVRASSGVALAADRRLPQALQTFVSLYGTWLEGMRARRSGESDGVAARMRRLVILMVLDAALLIALVVGVALSMPRLVAFFERTVGLDDELLRLLIAAATVVAALPFGIGILGCVRRLGALLAAEALPHVQPGHLDLAAAPRRALVAGLQLLLFLAIGAPILALTQPFLPPLPGAGVMLLLLALVAFLFWRRATNLQGHVRAGAAMIVEVLGRQSRQAAPPTLEQVRELLPGLGELTPVRVPPDSPAIGRTPAELELHGRSGATVVCVMRGQKGLVGTGEDAVLEPGDVVALTGTPEAIRGALEVLAPAHQPASPS